MKTTWAFALLAVTSLFALPQNTDFSQKDKPETLKVLIEQDASHALLEMKGKFAVFNPYNGIQISSGMFGKKATISSNEYGLKWGELFPGMQALRFVPADASSYVLINGIQYKGCVETYGFQEHVTVINEVDIENFLKSTLIETIEQPLHEEVLNAMAIIARTNACYVRAKGKTGLWHVDAKTERYSGCGLAHYKPFVDKAVDATRHAVLSFQGAPFAAAWTEHSAGQTADIATIFRKTVLAPPGVSAPFAAKERLSHQWSFAIPKQALAEAVRLGSVRSVDTYVAPGTPKVYAIKLSNQGESADIDFLSLQKIIGKEKLQSNDFTVSIDQENVVFQGYGKGPGVGLCLYSARIMASKGLSAKEMLQTFFPGAKLERKEK